LKKTPTGKNLLESLDKSGKQVTIKPVDDPDEGNSVDIGNQSFVGSDGTPGKGSNSIIHYNADNKVIGNKEWETRPPAIGLAHELIHADQAAHGTMSEGEVKNDEKFDPSNPDKVLTADISEVEAVGIPPHDKRQFTENKIRSEWDPEQPKRKWY
jgi:type VI secretion system secreted protein VgrG